MQLQCVPVNVTGSVVFFFSRPLSNLTESRSYQHSARDGDEFRSYQNRKKARAYYKKTTSHRHIGQHMYIIKSH